MKIENKKFRDLKLKIGMTIKREIINFPDNGQIKLKPRIWIIDNDFPAVPRSKLIFTKEKDYVHEKDFINGARVFSEPSRRMGNGPSAPITIGNEFEFYISFVDSNKIRGYIIPGYTLELTPDLNYYLVTECETI
jgi:hypothetical protein